VLDGCSRYFFYSEDGGDTSSETSVYIKPTRRNITEDGILHSHRRENLEAYICWCWSTFVDVHSTFGPLHNADMDTVADIAEICATSIFQSKIE
jgi:hypothetical protein